jgi:hypothetical protein
MEQLERIHLQTVELANCARIRGLTELGPQQRERFVVIGAAIPTPADFAAGYTEDTQTRSHDFRDL